MQRYRINCVILSTNEYLRTAENYLEYSAFSKSGLGKQLDFEGFSKSEVEYALDNIEADWYYQAARMAKQYLDYSSFSRSGLVKQLKFEGFTTKQAEYGVEQSY